LELRTSVKKEGQHVGDVPIMEGNTADMSLEDYLQLINVGFTYEHGSYPISWMVQGYIFFRKPGMETLSYTL
jgi:hypothetical protein